ncbi:MAG TPA: crotonase/enoyl-CoA hydratase family protein [Rhodocyclaceae bacterium]
MNTSESIASQPLFRDYTQFRVRFEPEDGVLRVSMQGRPVPCYSEALLEEARAIQCSIEAGGGLIEHAGEMRRLEYVVLDSQVPGVFNLGGDIALFRRLIESRDRDGLTRYARLCVDVCHRNIVHYNLPCLSISLVAGKALGGGMESALSGNVVIAERSAEFGLPEVLFNLFPGMGAYNLIARRIGPRLAEELITSGRTYSGEELHRMGLVDVLANDGQGEKALEEYLHANKRKQKTLHALAAVRETLSPVTHEDLLKVVPIWVESALGLDARDLKVMERLVKAQSRAFVEPTPAGVTTAGASVRMSLA